MYQPISNIAGPVNPEGSIQKEQKPCPAERKGKNILPFDGTSGIIAATSTKRTTMKRAGIFILIGILCVFLSFPSHARGERFMSVQIRNGAVRSTPTFFGKIVATATYGDRVILRGERGVWKSVVLQSKRSTGWMHESALTKEEIVLRAGTSDVRAGASSDEIAIAGKGFSTEVEEEFRRKNRNVDFTWVDRMVRVTFSEEELLRFLREGELNIPGEGQ
jgi:hypothetical protein